jgi:hypothetical protein
MKKFKLILGALTMLTASSAIANTLVLDSFNYSLALNLTVNPGPGNDFATDDVVSAETFADAVYGLTYTSTDPGTSGASANKAFISNGKLAYEESPDGDGTLSIAYSLPGGATLDFSGFSDFYFDVSFIDGSGGFDVMLTLEDGDGTMISATYTVTTTGVFLASFANMMAGLDFDFTKVASATAFISSEGEGDDFSLDSVGLVPAPASLALLGLGLLGLGLRSRKSM